MKVISDLCVVPIDVGVSVSKEIAICERILSAAGLQTHLYAYGTNIEGDWDRVPQLMSGRSNLPSPIVASSRYAPTPVKSSLHSIGSVASSRSTNRAE
jgi:hypothetical protein